MGIFKDLIGTIRDRLQLNKTEGPILKDNSGHLHIRNSNDSGFARASGLPPVNDEDFVTKGFLASTGKSFLIVPAQANTSSSLPTNTAVERYVVVTTGGTGAVIGDVLRDDGSNSGNMTILPAIEGRTIFVTDSLTGGVITFEADTAYGWDEDGSAWVKIGDIGNLTGAVRRVRYTLNNSATQDSSFQIPTSARVSKVALITSVAYSGGATISIGNTATPDLLMLTTENNPQATHTWEKDSLDISWPSLSVVRTTVTGSPAAGSGVCIVDFSIPNG